MTMQEFTARTGYKPTVEEFDTITVDYIESHLDKDEYCARWLDERLPDSTKGNSLWRGVRARARVKVITDSGNGYLMEIRGLKEGMEVEGVYRPKNRAFDFTWRGGDAMLWVGENAELVSVADRIGRP